MPRNTTRAEPGRRDLTDAARASALFVQSVEKAMTLLSAFHHADGPQYLLPPLQPRHFRFRCR